MAACCGAPRCNCRVTAGPGVTVDGNGSAATPYVISADSATPTAVQAADTATVDTTVAGSGTTADPYVVSSDVILDPAPPGGGNNLLQLQPGTDGLYVECADVRTCFSAGDGAAYDPATGEFAARPSTDAGNLVTFGTDGGLLATAPAADPTAVDGGDTPTAHNSVTGTGTAGDPYVVTTDVVLAPAPPGGGSNLAHAGPDGLYVECADVRSCLSAGDGITYDPATGEIAANISGDADNTTVIGTDGGIYTPAAATVLEAADTPTVDVTVSGTGSTADPYQVAAAVILDPTPPQGGTNLLQAGPEGLFVECADVRGCLTAGDGIAYDPATGEIEARPSTDAGNIVTFGTDGGLYATGGGGTATVVQAGDTPTANNTVSGTGTAGDPYVVSTDVVLDPAPPGGGSNLLQSGADGLFVECADVRGCLTAGDGITYDPATGEISANISTDAGNTTVVGTDGGLYTPAGSTVLVSADTSTVDTTITGNGTAGDPYTIEADVIVAPDPNGVEVAANGLLVAPSVDAGNQLAFGADGRLFVPEDPPLEIGCGLQGDGTAAAPLAAFPIAGLTAWSDSWACTDTDHSTLKCDPDTGALWTPPEHFSAADHLYQEHMNPVVANQGPTGGWAFLQPGGAAAVLSFNVPGNFLGNHCRKWSYSSHCHGSIDISYSSTATFQVGYIYQENGAALQIRPLWGILTAAGSARRERYSGSTAETAFDVLPANGVTLNYFAAINVTAGTITINSWTSDGTIHTTTQSS
ncbi:hypothetical protein [Streptomyces sp. NPDC058891]|uniref:hypothetical protein n=1 Tax=Streptomyces sp. NPDC058891 TaxID=3346667 RepID=UPI0036A2CF56